MKTTIPQLPIVDIVAKECHVPVQRLASVVPVTGSTSADSAFSILSAEEKVDLADFEVVCVCVCVEFCSTDGGNRRMSVWVL